MFFPVSVFANENNYVGCDLIGVEESKFENLIEEIQNIETTHPEYTEEMIKNVLDERHQEKVLSTSGMFLLTQKRSYVFVIHLTH